MSHVNALFITDEDIDRIEELASEVLKRTEKLPSDVLITRKQPGYTGIRTMTGYSFGSGYIVQGPGVPFFGARKPEPEHSSGPGVPPKPRLPMELFEAREFLVEMTEDMSPGEALDYVDSVAAQLTMLLAGDTALARVGRPTQSAEL